MAENPYATPKSDLSLLSADEVGPPFTEPRKGVILALYASVGATVLNLTVLGLQDSLLRGGAFEPADIDANDMRVGLSALLGLVIHIVCIVVWCRWTLNAARNLRSIEPEATFEFTPGWTVGWYFIPFLNLVRPYQAMKEIITYSIPDDDTGLATHSHGAGLWWGMWLISNFLTNASWRLAPAEGATDALEQLRYASYVEMGADLFALVAALTALSMIKQINLGQLKKAGREIRGPLGAMPGARFGG